MAKGSLYAIAFFIVLFNQLAYSVCLLSVDLVGFHYQSQRVTAYTIACSFCQVFNTGILLTLSSSNFKGQFLEFTGLKAGRYSDFEPSWYFDVAPLIF